MQGGLDLDVLHAKNRAFPTFAGPKAIVFMLWTSMVGFSENQAVFCDTSIAQF
jgi:hypothetical protein